jgi:hypothetical protein
LLRFKASRDPDDVPHFSRIAFDEAGKWWVTKSVVSFTLATRVARVALVLSLSATVMGCVHVPPPASRAQINALKTQLVALGPQVSEAEANVVAVLAYDYPRWLAQEYQLVRPPLWHNLLINLGLKKRGLCYHWAEDLAMKLRAVNLQELELHWAVARPGSWREHNAVVVTARRESFGRGIVLDPWRQSGALVWTNVTEDAYQWQEGVLPWVEAAPVAQTSSMVRVHERQ